MRIMPTSLALAAGLLLRGACAGAVGLDAQVPPGSTPAQVESALGRPRSRVVQQSGGHTRVIWVYGSSRRRPLFTRGDRGTGTPQGGPLFGVGKPESAPPEPEDYHEKFYVVFENGRVASVTDVAP